MTFPGRRGHNTSAILGTAAVLLATVGVARADAPAPAHAGASAPQAFAVDPVVDGILAVGGLTFTGFLNLVLSTGEIQPRSPGDPQKLLGIDRVAVTQTIDAGAGRRADWTVAGVVVFAALDPILSGLRGGRQALLVDLTLYAESLALTLSFNGLTKIGVRRPRPIEYLNCAPGAVPGPDCARTDMELSFFSGHTATAAAVTATASYLAFQRHGRRSARPWLTLGAGTLLTAFIGYERVRAGQHFPTDVMAGAVVGAGIGVVVPHLHRRTPPGSDGPPVWIAVAPTGGGASLALGARF